MKHKLYNRLLSLALAVGLVIGMLPCAAAVDTVGDAGQPVTLDGSTIETPDGLEISKTIVKDGDGYKVQLEAYTTGNITSTGGESVPADIVLVLDMSGSMDYCLICGESEDEGNHGWWGHKFTPRINSLKTAVNGFIDSVAEDAKKNSVSHKISIVKFAGNEKFETGNDSYKSDGYWYNYSQIVKGLTNASSGQSELKKAVDSLEPNGSTRIDYGLSRANAVFTDSAPEGRNRIVVAFTDGEPTDGSKFSETVANNAISQANTLKNQKGATIYSVGVFSGADGTDPANLPSYNSDKTNRFMHLVSSNYPDATKVKPDGRPSYNTNTGELNPDIDTTDPNDSYYLAASDEETLNNIFQQISDEVQGGGSSFALDENAVIKDVMSDYFQLPANVNENDVTVEYYKAQYSGSDLSWSKDFSYNPQITKQITTDSKGEDVVNVSGFDFDHNFVSEKGRVEGDVTQSGNFYGRKIVITFPIEVKDGFFGGNNVPTNDSASGIYKNGTETTPVGQFEIPNLNIPVNCNVTGNDQSIYITQSADVTEMVNLGAEPDGWNNSHVTITYQVKDGETVIGTYTIEPGATTGTWDGDSVSPEDCKDYTVTCTVTPNNGTYDSVNDSPVGAWTGSDNATVHVFTPTVTWTDSTKAYGTVIDENLLNGHQVSIAWNDMSNDVNAPAPSGTAPTLTYTFTGENGALPGTLTDEAHVKVSGVKIGENDITDATSFEWQKDGSCPETCDDPNDAYQFRIHVQKGGLTITKTVEGLDENGLNELKGRLTFDVTGNNGYEQTVLFNATGWTYTPNQDGTYTCTYTLDVPTGSYTVTENGYENITNYLFDSSSSTIKVENVVVTTTGAPAALKNVYTPADGYLKIVKDIINGTPFGDGRDTFNFKVTAISGKDAGKVWYFTINGEGTVVDKFELPVGDYKVEELSNINYTRNIISQTVTISNSDTQESPKTVTFTNTPNKTDIPTDGSGVVNIPEIKDGQITWKQEEEKDPIPAPTH